MLLRAARHLWRPLATPFTARTLTPFLTLPTPTLESPPATRAFVQLLKPDVPSPLLTARYPAAERAAFATNRQRIKTPSCLKRRFKKTGNGKFIRFGAFHSHNLSKKSKRQRKYGKRKHLVPKSFAKVLKKLNFNRR